MDFLDTAKKALRVMPQAMPAARAAARPLGESSIAKASPGARPRRCSASR